MATEYYSGTAGRVKVVKVAPDLTTSMITWSGSTATLVESDGWDLNYQRDGGPPEALTFEADADDEGTLFPTLMRGGVARWTGSVSCLVNGDTTNSFETLPDGCAFVGDFIFHKSAPDGILGVKCLMIGRPIKTGVKDKTATYTINFAVSGKLPTPSL